MIYRVFHFGQLPKKHQKRPLFRGKIVAVFIFNKTATNGDITN